MLFIKKLIQINSATHSKKLIKIISENKLGFKDILIITDDIIHEKFKIFNDQN